MKSESGNGRFTVLEGNRRAVAIKILKNPAILTGLDVRAPLQKKLENIGRVFRRQVRSINNVDKTNTLTAYVKEPA